VQADELRIYDPYFCNGAVQRHLAALGFPRVHNRNEDFYEVQAQGRVPPHDVVVTNPPYSGSHPQRLFGFLEHNRRPWLALMPNWVCARDYYGAATRGAESPFYLVPRKRYHYWTPRGRRADVAAGGAKAKTHAHTNAALGARTSPFVSFWYAGGFPATARARLSPPEGCVLCSSVDALPPAVRADGWAHGQGWQKHKRAREKK